MDRMDGRRGDAGGIGRRRLLLGAGALALAGGRTQRVWAAEGVAPEAPPPTPQAALEELRTGNARFAGGELLQPRRELDRLKQLGEGQKPYAAILGCADSRVPIEIVFDEGFGDLFVVRVAGNVATPTEIASLEYAVAVLGVQAILVLGHGSCGAVKAALAGAAVPGQISTLYQHIVPGIDRTKDLTTAIAANVRFQARQLRQASPVIGGGLTAGTLALAGGVFELGSGRVTPVDVD
ncbi:MAG: carbonic anhydrase [bacterium]|nr:carbonic anhydrase [bacterium]